MWSCGEEGLVESKAFARSGGNGWLRDLQRRITVNTDVESTGFDIALPKVRREDGGSRGEGEEERRGGQRRGKHSRRRKGRIEMKRKETRINARNASVEFTSEERGPPEDDNSEAYTRNPSKEGRRKGGRGGGEGNSLMARVKNLGERRR